MKVPILIGLILAIAIAFVYYQKIKSNNKKHISKTEFPPRPKWKPVLPIDYEAVEKTFAYYLGSNEADFVIFENGTCVPLQKGIENPEVEAKNILDTLFNSHPDFNPLEMDDGNWMVTMSDKAFVICFKEELEKNWDYIDRNHQHGVATSEVLLNSANKPNTFDRRGKIGLFGRARWYLDAEFKKNIKTVQKID